MTSSHVAVETSRGGSDEQLVETSRGGSDEQLVETQRGGGDKQRNVVNGVMRERSVRAVESGHTKRCEKRKVEPREDLAQGEGLALR